MFCWTTFQYTCKYNVCTWHMFDSYTELTLLSYLTFFDCLFVLLCNDRRFYLVHVHLSRTQGLFCLFMSHLSIKDVHFFCRSVHLWRYSRIMWWKANMQLSENMLFYKPNIIAVCHTLLPNRITHYLQTADKTSSLSLTLFDINVQNIIHILGDKYPAVWNKTLC